MSHWYAVDKVMMNVKSNDCMQAVTIHILQWTTFWTAYPWLNFCREWWNSCFFFVIAFPSIIKALSVLNWLGCLFLLTTDESSSCWLRIFFWKQLKCLQWEFSHWSPFLLLVRNVVTTFTPLTIHFVSILKGMFWSSASMRRFILFRIYHLY
jgi:hypothetical protein